MRPPLRVVRNLDVAGVTWARSFLRAAAQAGVPCSDEPARGHVNLYLGDELPTPRVGRTVYFLAAFSATPGECDDSNQRVRELANIHAADLTITVSEAETARVRTFAPSARLHTGGFPVAVTACEKVGRLDSAEIRMDAVGTTGSVEAADHPARIDGARRTHPFRGATVCFIADDRPIKGLVFERQLILRLHALGYRTVHLSPSTLSNRRGLERLGCTVYEGLSGPAYWSVIAETTHFCSTSAYESLCVSGIEAAMLGCACAAPDVGGFRDWCPERYTPGDVASALASIAVARPYVASLQRYLPRRFFSTVVEALQ